MFYLLNVALQRNHEKSRFWLRIRIPSYTLGVKKHY